MKGVILDIDITLVHSVEKHLVKKEWKDMFEWFDIDSHITFLRPKVWEFIDFLFNEGYEVGIFTAGSEEYAKQIVEGLFAGRNLRFVYSVDDYNKCIDKYWRAKYIKYVSDNYPGEWVIVDDANNVKSSNGDLCYKIKPFIVCFDDTFELKEGTENDEELVKCMEWIRVSHKV